jgi:hypothetical protein
MRHRPGKRKSVGCPQWVLDGVRAVREEATTRERNSSAQEATGNKSLIRYGGKIMEAINGKDPSE